MSVNLSGKRGRDAVLLPEDIATKRAAIVARSGGGKTYTAAVFAEELTAAGQPWYALDPTGAWWGLRASASGKRAGMPVVVIGGEHGDVPLDPTAGALVADVVVEHPSFYVIDMSEIGTRAGEVRFATAFLDRLYRAKSKNRAPLHGFWDEADLFAPQRSGPDEARMLGAAEQVVRRGRIRGLGTTMITQRPAVVNKNVLSQIDVLVALKMGDPRDRAAIEDWLKGTPDQEKRREVMDSLAGLGLGEAWVYGPGETPVLYARTRIRERRTFNSSAAGTGTDREVRLADVDVAALSERMAAQIEKARADDPKVLRERIRALEAQLAERPAAVPERVEVRVEVPVLPGGLRETLEAQQLLLERLAPDVLQARARAQYLVSEIEGLSELGQMIAEEATRAVAPESNGEGPRRSPDAQPRSAPASRRAPQPAEGVTPARQRVLDAIAWFARLGIDAPTREALAPMAGSKATSGGFKNNLGALGSAGLIDYPQPNCVALTDEGSAAAVWPERAGTSEELQDAVLQTLSPARQRLLRLLLGAWPEAMTRERLAELAGVPVTSGGFKNNLGAMRTQGVIDYPSQGLVAATDLLFVKATDR